MESDSNKLLDEVTQGEYKYGFVTEIDTEFAAIGLSEDTIRYISQKKNEPEFMLEFRLKAYRHWLTMKQPEWAHLTIDPIDFQSMRSTLNLSPHSTSLASPSKSRKSSLA